MAIWTKIYQGEQLSHLGVWTAGTNRILKLLDDGLGGITAEIWSIAPTPTPPTLEASLSISLPADVEFYPQAPNKSDSSNFHSCVGSADQDPYSFDVAMVAQNTVTNAIYVAVLTPYASSLTISEWVEVYTASATTLTICKHLNSAAISIGGDEIVIGVDLLTGAVNWTRLQGGYGVDSSHAQAMVSSDIWLGGFEKNAPGGYGNLESQYIYCYYQGSDVGTLDVGASVALSSGTLHPMSDGTVLAIWARYDSDAFAFWDLCARPISASSSGIAWMGETTILGSGTDEFPNETYASHHAATAMVVLTSTTSGG